MTTQSSLPPLSPGELEQYGYARARDLAFDAVQMLWRRRKAEGMTQKDVAAAIDWDEGLLSKKLSGPGNWTLRTLGALVEALRGDLQIVVAPVEQPLPGLRRNADAYSGYRSSPLKTDIPAASTSSGTVFHLTVPTTASSST